MFQKGMVKIAGRTKGTPNQLTANFRQAVLLAYDTIGGHAAFSQWAVENRTEFYRIAARLIPVEIVDADSNRVVVHIHRGPPPSQIVDLQVEAGAANKEVAR
jgi:hypothetical protein